MSPRRGMAPALLGKPPPEKNNRRRTPENQPRRDPHEEPCEALILDGVDPGYAWRERVGRIKQVVGQGEKRSEPLHREREQNQIEHLHGWLQAHLLNGRQDGPPDNERGPDEKQVLEDMKAEPEERCVVKRRDVPHRKRQIEDEKGDRRPREKSNGLVDPGWP